MKLQFYSNNCNIHIFWFIYIYIYIYTYQVKNFHVAVTDNVIEKTNLFIGRLCINID